ncbi:DeoR family transcriptional regulator [Candidatus Peregrinibacteria bacterium]|nr:DeoR family transcriptional regulator [Candidatus Peregrinibacteria bacterium]
MSEDRKRQVLKSIINHFIQTAEPVGSNTILVSYHFHVSPATIRNDMVELEDEGYIYQPHTSAGRVPTDKAYRLFVDEMIDYEKDRKEAVKLIQTLKRDHDASKVREELYDAISILARATNLVSFATTPDKQFFRHNRQCKNIHRRRKHT